MFVSSLPVNANSENKLFMYSVVYTLFVQGTEFSSNFIKTWILLLLPQLFIVFSIFCLGRSKKKERCLNEDMYPLEENQTCPCNEFLSQPFGNWSACILPNPPVFESLHGWMRHREVKECGQGLRYRAVACIDQRGHLVNPKLCTDSGIIEFQKLSDLWSS